MNRYVGLFVWSVVICFYAVTGGVSASTDIEKTHCGDGTKQTPNDFGRVEQCDDGNQKDGDGCNNLCVIEKTHCGDGTKQTPNDFGRVEQCDDGNQRNGDGCSNLCVIEREYCGDGTKQTPNGFGEVEACDDGNKKNGDGCSSTCGVEKTYCGDGTKQTPNNFGKAEQCDDGNKKNGDGCSSLCKIEKTYCGDGTKQTPNNFGRFEACDDGNKKNGDGCSSTCVVEKTYCGDGTKQTPNNFGEAEACDDGNKKNGDGCSSTCGIEKVANPVQPDNPISAQIKKLQDKLSKLIARIKKLMKLYGDDSVAEKISSETVTTKFTYKNNPDITVFFKQLSSSVLAGQSVVIKVATNSTGCAIRRADFVVNNKMINSDNSKPFEFNWKPVKSGEYKIKVVVEDCQGLNAYITKKIDVVNK